MTKREKIKSSVRQLGSYLSYKESTEYKEERKLLFCNLYRNMPCMWACFFPA